MDSIHQTRLAQSVEHQTWNLRVVGSSPIVDKEFFSFRRAPGRVPVNWETERNEKKRKEKKTKRKQGEK